MSSGIHTLASSISGSASGGGGSTSRTSAGAAWEDDPAASPPPSPAYADDVDEGPATEAVDVLAERDADDDAYLAELRKAMTDESPLGPREDDEAAVMDPADEPPRSRFGRRR